MPDYSYSAGDAVNIPYKYRTLSTLLISSQRYNFRRCAQLHQDIPTTIYPSRSKSGQLFEPSTLL